MGPLLLANWRAINRAFCFVLWMVALALAVVIIGHVGTASSKCSSVARVSQSHACSAGAGLADR